MQGCEPILVDFLAIVYKWCKHPTLKHLSVETSLRLNVETEPSIR